MDQSLNLLKDPYLFISKRAYELGVDIFRDRLLLQSTVFMRGEEAAELFYDTHHFVRKGAAPEALKATLLGKGGVQGMDDKEHRHRKEMFMSLMSEESVDRLTASVKRWFYIYTEKWTREGTPVVLFDAFQEILTLSVCEWAGVPLRSDQIKLRTDELTSLFNLAGSKGPGHLWARIQRKKSEAWIKKLVRAKREAGEPTREFTPVEVIIFHKDLTGNLLDEHTAAVEILNILRPVVAVSVFMDFVVHALVKNEVDNVEYFVQEVRRFYPFFPAAVAKVRDDFTWKGFEFKKDERVMLDLYGMDHDPRVWENPEVFNPARFDSWNKSAFNFIPQGGGDHKMNHRCPGEFITIALMKLTTEFFTEELHYHVPEQDLEIDFTRLPALPKSRMIISDISLKPRVEIPLNAFITTMVGSPGIGL